VTLRWAVPTEPNGILTGYIVGYRRGEQKSDTDFNLIKLFNKRYSVRFVRY